MAQKKAHEVEGWLRRPDATPIVLLYGPDHGLVAERAQSYAAGTGLPLDDPFTVVRLEADEADESGRLIDEAYTVSMFAAQRLIWVRGASAQKRLADDVKALGDRPPEQAVILIEAGDLRKGAGLRSIAEASRNAIALPCYADGDRELDALIDGVLGESGLSISFAARRMLRESLGGDRLATRSELEKLSLYALGKQAVDVQDIVELTGDVAELSVSDAVDAALAGAVEAFDRHFTRYCRAGGQPFLALNAAIRSLQSLRLLRAELDGSRRGAAAVVDAAKPPVHFSRKKNVAAALNVWTLDAIDHALARLMEIVLDTRKRADLAEALTTRALTSLAVQASRRIA